jgi:hypothetical protein
MIPDRVTIGEKYDPAMKVHTKAEAQAYFDECVEHDLRLRPELSREEAEHIERQNIGYYFGYQRRDEACRLQELYGFTHPLINIGTDTPEDIVRKGITIGNRMKQ